MTSQQISVHRRTEDRRVEEDIRAELDTLGIACRGALDISVDQGVVRLTGMTDSYARKYAIERAVSRVLGVRDVRDYLEVRPHDPEARTDILIELAARHTLEWDARVPPGVGADVTEGVVRLHGTVERFAQREAAEEAVRNLVGLRDVWNEIRIVHPAPVTDLGGAVKSAIRRRFGAACRHVWVAESDGIVTVSGVVASLELLGEVESAVHSVPGVLYVSNRLLVA